MPSGLRNAASASNDAGMSEEAATPAGVRSPRESMLQDGEPVPEGCPEQDPSPRLARSIRQQQAIMKETMETLARIAQGEAVEDQQHRVCVLGCLADAVLLFRPPAKPGVWCLPAVTSDLGDLEKELVARPPMKQLEGILSGDGKGGSPDVQSFAGTPLAPASSFYKRSKSRSSLRRMDSVYIQSSQTRDELLQDLQVTSPAPARAQKRSDQGG